MNELEQLGTLDPARNWRPSADDRIAAEALVDRLVSGEDVPRPRPVKRRVLVGAAAAVLVTAGVAVAPALLPVGGGGNQAYAAWAKPRQMGAEQALATATDCATKWGDEWGRMPITSDVVLAEQRGSGSLLLVAKGGSKDLVDCITLDPKQGVDGSELLVGSSGMLGPAKASVLSVGASDSGQPGGSYSVVIGRAGSDITGVDVSVPGGSTVHATLKAGWWVAWWPGKEAGVADGVRIDVETKKGTKTYKPSQL